MFQCMLLYSLMRIYQVIAFMKLESTFHSHHFFYSTNAFYKLALMRVSLWVRVCNCGIDRNFELILKCTELVLVSINQVNRNPLKEMSLYQLILNYKHVGPTRIITISLQLYLIHLMSFSWFVNKLSMSKNLDYKILKIIFYILWGQCLKSSEISL